MLRRSDTIESLKFASKRLLQLYEELACSHKIEASNTWDCKEAEQDAADCLQHGLQLILLAKQIKPSGVASEKRKVANVLQRVFLN